MLILPSKPNKNPNNNKKPSKPSKPKTLPNLPVKIDKEVDVFGDFLLEQDKMIAAFIAKGFTDAEVKELFKVDDKYMAKLRLNPNFIKSHNSQVMSTGMANKVERVAKAKRAAEKIADAFFKKVEEGELDKQNVTTLWRMSQESLTQMAALMGEDKVVEQNINILVKEVIRERTGKAIDDFNSYDPATQFPVINVQAEKIKPENKDER